MPTFFDDLSLEHSETRSCSNRAARASNDVALADASVQPTRPGVFSSRVR